MKRRRGDLALLRWEHIYLETVESRPLERYYGLGAEHELEREDGNVLRRHKRDREAGRRAKRYLDEHPSTKM